jgi:glycerate-2-kinase
VLAALRRDALAIVRAALSGVDPGRLIERALTGAAGSDLASFDGFYICAAGKAAAGMLRPFLEWAGPRARGTLVARGTHPAPDRESVRSAEVALDFARWTTDRVGLVLLLSGGASAMMAMPAEGLSLEDKIDTGRLLLAAGVPIEGMNAVRKHLSAIKGGRLAAQASATHTLAISDVTGPHEDDLAVIGSGPGVPDASTYEEAVEILHVHHLWERVPRAVTVHLHRGRQGLVDETPKLGDERLARSIAHVIGGRRDAMAAARSRAEALGYRTTVAEAAVQGEAADVGRALAEQVSRAPGSAERLCVISSGETTVLVRGQGRGGRNQELGLAAIEPLARSGRRAVLASVGTDGVDGPTDAAGAIVDSASARRAGELGVDLAARLHDNDSYSALAALGDLLRTGPTGTNVGDLQVLLVG